MNDIYNPPTGYQIVPSFSLNDSVNEEESETWIIKLPTHISLSDLKSIHKDKTTIGSTDYRLVRAKNAPLINLVHPRASIIKQYELKPLVLDLPDKQLFESKGQHILDLPFQKPRQPSDMKMRWNAVGTRTRKRQKV